MMEFWIWSEFYIELNRCVQKIQRLSGVDHPEPHLAYACVVARGVHSHQSRVD